MMHDKERLLAEIDACMARICAARPLNAGELQALRKALQVEFTYNSNAIEGNTLSLAETKLLIEDGVTVGGKTVREMNEALNHKQMFDLLYEVIEQQNKITQDLILQLHGLVLQNIDDANAGKYRELQVSIAGDEKLPPAPRELKPLMDAFIVWAATSAEGMHAAEFAAELHYRFVKIHPFIDGNGRTVRILINIFLMQQGYPMIVIPVARRQEYVSTLNSGRSFDDFRLFFLDVVLQNLKDYERMIDPDAF